MGSYCKSKNISDKESCIVIRDEPQDRAEQSGVSRDITGPCQALIVSSRVHYLHL